MKYLVLISLFITTPFVFSQKKEMTNLHFNLEYGCGAIIPEYQFVNSLVEKNIQQIELSVLKKTNGSNFWQKKYKYPQFGCALFFTTLGNKVIFGEELALYPFVLFQSNPSKKIHINNKLGLGLGFATKKFDLLNDYQNVAIGSHLNVHFRYHFGIQYDINSNLSLNTGINFYHFSNANMHEPNLGLNLLSASFGITHTISKQVERLSPEIPIFKPENEFLIIASFGGKHTRALQSKVYPTSSFAFEFNRKLSHTFSFGTGLDVFYDASTKVEMSVSDESSFKSAYNFRTGIHIAQAFVYNKFSFILQEGIYLGLVDEVDHKKMYNKVIMRYKFNSHVGTQIAVKSHLHILDYPEVGFSYYF